MPKKLKITFGRPEHGWLPTTLSYRDFELKIEISDVPINPMYQLLESLIQITKGIKSPDIVIWHLEPYCYYLQLEQHVKAYKLIILESDQLESPKKNHQEFIGDFESIILPLYRGLKKFWAVAYKPPHWDILDSKRMEQLTELIKQEKRT